MTWWKTAKPGDGVVCIALPEQIIDLQNPTRSASGLYVGNIYVLQDIKTAEEILQAPPGYFDNDNPDHVLCRVDGYGGPYISVSCFKPVEKTTRKTDISVFNEILRTAKVPATEEV